MATADDMEGDMGVTIGGANMDVDRQTQIQRLKEEQSQQIIQRQKAIEGGMKAYEQQALTQQELLVSANRQKALREIESKNLISTVVSLGVIVILSYMAYNGIISARTSSSAYSTHDFRRSAQYR